MLVLGLTGSIGMGKTTTAACFAKRGVPVCNADLVVHELYDGAAVPAIEAAFPEAVREDRVDRGLLAQAIAGKPERLRALEAIIHPMVVEAEMVFLREEAARGTEMALLEIPLLFESKADERVDVTIVVSAPAETQRERVMARPGMTEEKFDALLARQFPDALKRERADFIVDTGGSLDQVERQVDRVLLSLKGRKGTAMDRLRRLYPETFASR